MNAYYFFPFNITFLWLPHACWRFTACQFVSSYVIKLGTMFAIWKSPPATCSNSKQASSFKTELIGNNAEVSRVNHNILWCLTFPRSRQQTFCLIHWIIDLWPTIGSAFKQTSSANVHKSLHSVSLRCYIQAEMYVILLSTIHGNHGNHGVFISLFQCCCSPQFSS